MFAEFSRNKLHHIFTLITTQFLVLAKILIRFLVLVKAPCECTTGIIERGLRSRDDNARGAAECVIDSRDRKPRSIIPVVYEHERCFNWFVARFEPVKQEKARGNDGLRTAVHARILQRAVMNVAADALAESVGAVASELLLATENAADDPNFSISPENCARYGIYCTVVRGMAFIVLSVPLICPRIVLQISLLLKKSSCQSEEENSAYTNTTLQSSKSIHL